MIYHFFHTFINLLIFALASSLKFLILLLSTNFYWTHDHNIKMVKFLKKNSTNLN